jgi:hypothetical protein
MQVIQAASPITRADRLSVVRAGALSVVLLAGGAAAAWIFVSTPLIGSFVPEGRPTVVQVGAGMTVWALAIIAPTGLMVLGLVRLFRSYEAATALRQTGYTPSLERSLGPEHVAIVNLILPGGRRVSEMVMGPFGVVVLGEMPPPKASRHVGSRWEMRGRGGRWVTMETPVERASRDAERVRAWLGEDDRDFLVRVYAAVVTGDKRVERTATCAVVAPDELLGWLLALPVQRGLTPGRRERLIGYIRTGAAAR